MIARPGRVPVLISKGRAINVLYEISTAAKIKDLG